MLNYTDEEIKAEIESILETGDFTIKPVGNHHLKRHLVYQIDMRMEESTYLTERAEFSLLL